MSECDPPNEQVCDHLSCGYGHCYQREAVSSSYAEGERAATERIVKWLRKRAAYWHQRFPNDKSMNERADVLVDMADAIERGEHE